MGKLDTLLQQTISTLRSLLDDMFASCDDMYFDLASSAKNNKEQNAFFESMRIVRIGSTAAANAFEREIRASFDIKPDQSENVSGQEFSADKLGIVGDEETEKSVTLTAMTSRARAISRTALFEIEQRLNQLDEIKVVIEQKNNPVDPEKIINAFAAATDSLELEVNARIILYKQFERLILRRLPELYSNFNQRLEASGAKFERSASKETQNTGAQRKYPTRETAVAGLDDKESLVSPIDQSFVQVSLDELSSLLRHKLTLSSGYPRIVTSAAAEQIDREELLSLLNTSTPVYDGTRDDFDLRTYISSILQKDGDNGKEKSVAKVDEDVINLIALFFDFALEDDEIPDNFKALLSRLQMPTLKIAIKDGNFFSNAQHPCRSFINRVARLSMGVEADNKQSGPLLNLVESWIERIQNGDDETEELFDAALKALEEFTESLEKRSKLVEKRTAETAEGEAIKQVARLRAQKAIKEMLDGKVIDTEVITFISRQWQNVLYTAYARGRSESSEWTSCLQVMQDIVWCAQSHVDDTKAQNRFDRILTDLEHRIANGLKLTSLTDHQANELASKLLQRISCYHSDQGDAVPEATVFKAAENEHLDLIEPETSIINNAPAIPRQTHTIEHDISHHETQENLPSVIGSGSALEAQRGRYAQASLEFMRLAEQTEIGTWIEFKIQLTGNTVRCKLSSKISATDTYIFVNRFGFKTLEKSKQAFAEDLRRKRARVLTSGPLFDRSLGKMLSSLNSEA